MCGYRAQVGPGIRQAERQQFGGRKKVPLRSAADLFLTPAEGGLSGSSTGDFS